MQDTQLNEKFRQTASTGLLALGLEMPPWLGLCFLTWKSRLKKQL